MSRPRKTIFAIFEVPSETEFRAALFEQDPPALKFQLGVRMGWISVKLISVRRVETPTTLSWGFTGINSDPNIDDWKVVEGICRLSPEKGEVKGSATLSY